MQYTLLELIQRILSSIKGEEVNSYDDTAESLVVRDIIKECFYNIISNQDFPEMKSLFELNASGISNKPTFMTMPAPVVGIEWVKYNKATLEDPTARYEYVTYLPFEEFAERMHQLDPSADNVGSYSLDSLAGGTFDVYYQNDKAPDYYTSYDDNTILFDSYDSDVDTTLQTSKSLAYGLLTHTWVDDNNATLPLDAQQYNILIKEAKVMSWMELRQTENQAAAMQARKAKIAAEKKKDKVNYNHKGYYYDKFPNYGRK